MSIAANTEVIDAVQHVCEALGDLHIFVPAVCCRRFQFPKVKKELRDADFTVQPSELNFLLAEYA